MLRSQSCPFILTAIALSFLSCFSISGIELITVSFPFSSLSLMFDTSGLKEIKGQTGIMIHDMFFLFQHDR